MTYKILYNFNSTFAEDTPKSGTVTKTDPYTINVTAKVEDDKSAVVKGKILQFFTTPDTLVVMNDSGDYIAYDSTWGSYLIEPDADGNYSFWLAAPQKTIVSTALVVPLQLSLQLFDMSFPCDRLMCSSPK